MKHSWNCRKGKIASICLVTMLIMLFNASSALATYDLSPKKFTVKFAESEESNYTDLYMAGADYKVYLIAQMDEEGDYQVKDAYKDTGVQDIVDKANQSADVTADELLAVSDEIEALIADEQPDETGTVGESVYIVPGLYFIHLDEVRTGYHTYQFLPAMAFVPNQDSVSVKVEQKPLTAELTITKTLSAYDNLTGAPMFVFDITAVDDQNKVVYSDVVGMRFEKAGTQSITIKDIPAGSTVTVKELDAAASYSISSSAEIVLNKITEKESNIAEFVNDYNHRLVYGTGVVNHYTIHEDQQANGDTIYSWEWTQE